MCWDFSSTICFDFGVCSLEKLQVFQLLVFQILNEDFYTLELFLMEIFLVFNYDFESETSYMEMVAMFAKNSKKI